MSRFVALPVRGMVRHVNPGYVREVIERRRESCRVVFGGGAWFVVKLPAAQVLAMLEGRAGGAK